MKEFELYIEYIGDYVYIQSNYETTPVCYDAETPEDIANAVQKYIEKEI